MTAQENPGGWPDAPEWTLQDFLGSLDGSLDENARRMASYLRQKPSTLVDERAADLIGALLAERTTVAALVEAARADGAAAERERIIAAVDHEAEVCPCAEDAVVLRDTARLIRADFDYEAAEKLAEADDNQRAGGHDV